jgi:hypothetical protein
LGCIRDHKISLTELNGGCMYTTCNHLLRWPHQVTCRPIHPRESRTQVYWTLQHVQPKPPCDATCAFNLLNAPQPFAWRYNLVALLAWLHPLACYPIGFNLFVTGKNTYQITHSFGYIPILRVSTSHFHGSIRHDF